MTGCHWRYYAVRLSHLTQMQRLMSLLTGGRDLLRRACIPGEKGVQRFPAKAQFLEHIWTPELTHVLLFIWEFLGIRGSAIGENCLLGEGNGWICANGSPPHVHVFPHVTCERFLFTRDFNLLEQSVEESSMHLLPPFLQVCSYVSSLILEKRDVELQTLIISYLIFSTWAYLEMPAITCVLAQASRKYQTKRKTRVTFFRRSHVVWNTYLMAFSSSRTGGSVSSMIARVLSISSCAAIGSLLRWPSSNSRWKIENRRS